MINTKTQILFQLTSQHRNTILSVLVGDRINLQVFSSNREVNHDGIKITARNTQNGKRKQHVWEREELHRKFWWEKTDRRTTLERPKSRWKDNIKMGLYGVEWQHGLR